MKIGNTEASDGKRKRKADAVVHLPPTPSACRVYRMPIQVVAFGTIEERKLMGNPMGNIRCVCALPCNYKKSGKQAQPAGGTVLALLVR